MKQRKPGQTACAACGHLRGILRRYARPFLAIFCYLGVLLLVSRQVLSGEMWGTLLVVCRGSNGLWQVLPYAVWYFSYAFAEQVLKQARGL